MPDTAANDDYIIGGDGYAPFYVQPGVPAAGHIDGGYWHPGRIDTCRKGSCLRRNCKHERTRVTSSGQTTCVDCGGPPK